MTKYLTENQLPIVARALYLVAAPFEREDFGGEDGGDFMFDPHKLIRLESQLQKLYVFHSKDDQIVPYAHALKYHAALGSAMLVTFDDKGHFLSEDFPELVASILAVHSAKNVQ